MFITDSGLETSLVFHKGYDLPLFAAFPLNDDENGLADLREYYEAHAKIAVRSRAGFVLETHTWRANRDWANELGYNSQTLREANLKCVALMENIRNEYELPECPMVISGCIGPRGDGYRVDLEMSIDEAKNYHLEQVKTFTESSADFVSAFTLNYVNEAIGIVLAAQECGIPVVISFTTETDGKLPNGCTLAEAIEMVDAVTGNGPSYYMINCAHPDHFEDALIDGEKWTQRIRGIRANASRLSHAELDEAEELDSGDPIELAGLYRQLRQKFPHFSILGGCCGTDHRHIHEISQSCSHA
jgi:S-methylmethionine-dependent homocysteine/selenocysteine methylase